MDPEELPAGTVIAAIPLNGEPATILTLTTPPTRAAPRFGTGNLWLRGTRRTGTRDTILTSPTTITVISVPANTASIRPGIG